jgi:hypothetical protein
MYVASHHININGPHMRPCGRILKQWMKLSIILIKFCAAYDETEVNLTNMLKKIGKFYYTNT